MSTNLPGLTLSDTGRGSEMPDPLSRPTLYEGILWRRSFAYLVDACIILAVNFAIHVGLVLLGIVTLGLLLPIVLLAMSFIMFVTVAVLYDTLLVGGTKSATPGMRLFDIEARGTNGARPDHLQAFLNSALFYASIGVTGFLILLLGLFTERHRMLHDYLSAMLFTRRKG